MTNKESLFAGLHILMRTIPDGPEDAGRRLHRYWCRGSRCQVHTGWQKLCALCGYKSVKICVNPWLIFCAFLWLKIPRNQRNPRYEIRSTKDYVRKNKLFYAKRTQFPKSQMKVTEVLTKDYEKWTLGQLGKTNPKRTQF